MLTAYEARTNQLLQYPAPASNPLYSTADIKDWINQARQQIAGEGECIRYLGQVTVTNAGQQYAFSAIAFSGESAAGVASPVNVRNLWLTGSGGALTLLGPRPFEWLSAYALNTTAPFVGPPTQWAQLGQGEAGTIYLDNLPDQAYTLQADAVWYPVALADDTTAEAIPFPWTDAVAYYAAYLALLSSQAAVRQADAGRMFQRYEEFMRRARTQATPSVLPSQYPQNPSPFLPGSLGMQQRPQASQQ